MAKKENEFQRQLIKKLKTLFPDAIILKNDPNYLQGVPDLLILNNEHWAMLECKVPGGKFRPNQEYYLDKCNKMSFAREIDELNEQEVLDELLGSL